MFTKPIYTEYLILNEQYVPCKNVFNVYKSYDRCEYIVNARLSKISYYTVWNISDINWKQPKKIQR